MRQKCEVFANKFTGDEVCINFGFGTEGEHGLVHHLIAGAHLTLRAPGADIHAHTRAYTHALSQNKRNTYGVTLGSSAHPIEKRPLLLLFFLTESSDAVVTVHVSANVPKDHIEDEEYGEDKERY